MPSYDVLEHNVAVFKDTCSKCDDDNLPFKEYVRRSLSGQDIVLEDDEVVCVRDDVPAFETEVIVSKLRSFESASRYKGEHIAVLNFADWYKPGGEVLIGLPTQEEALCRVSTLYRCICSPKPLEFFYDAHLRSDVRWANDDLIYTPDVCVFKEDRPPNGMLSEDDRFFTDVITCAAPNLIRGSMSDEELGALHRKRLERMLSVAYSKGATHMILGAFGCGAFMNDPFVVAGAHKEVLSNWRGRFKVIEYPVFCESYESVNYQAFRDVLG